MSTVVAGKEITVPTLGFLLYSRDDPSQLFSIGLDVLLALRVPIAFCDVLVVVQTRLQVRKHVLVLSRNRINVPKHNPKDPRNTKRTLNRNKFLFLSSSSLTSSNIPLCSALFALASA